MQIKLVVIVFFFNRNTADQCRLVDVAVFVYCTFLRSTFNLLSPETRTPKPQLKPERENLQRNQVSVSRLHR